MLSLYLMELPSIQDGEDKLSPLKNKIRKNYRHVRKWAKRTLTTCFRIYDREIKEYPLAIDFYEGRFCVHFFTSSRESEDPPPRFQETVNEALHSLFGASSDSIYWRTRLKREKTEQYEKVEQTGSFFTVLEYGVKFRVNVVDYLDTGLFLDHRETRQLVAKASLGKRVLNLFAYTCSFSVQAALAGALSTTSVDLSNTYLAWGKENFILNQIPLEPSHIFLREDCLRFLSQASQPFYDVIVIDPPTLSRSKKMNQMFDIQQDYIYLISQALKLLNPGGVIFFSTNSRSFKFEEELFVESCEVVDISKKTLPLDFHSAKTHRCWKIFPKDTANVS